MPTLPRVRPPLQRRSRATLARILDATEALLEDGTFEQIGVQAIVRRAQTSVGAFYARFENKDALLPALYERYDRTMPVTREDLRDHGLDETGDFEERARQLVLFSVRTFRRRRGLLRAMTIHARVNPSAIPDDVRAKRSALHRIAADLLLEFADEIDHPQPKLAVDMGLYLVASTARERILFEDAPHASAVSIDDETLERELTRALLTYLRGPGPGAR